MTNSGDFWKWRGKLVTIADWCVFNPLQPESSGIALQRWSMRSLHHTAVARYVTARSSPPVSSRDIGSQRLTWYLVPLWRMNEHLHGSRINTITENLLWPMMIVRIYVIRSFHHRSSIDELMVKQQLKLVEWFRLSHFASCYFPLSMFFLNNCTVVDWFILNWSWSMKFLNFLNLKCLFILEFWNLEILID